MLEENLLKVATAIATIAGMWLLYGAVIMREELYDKLRKRHHP